MIRCGKCSKSKHYLCERAKCECNCRRYKDTVVNRIEPEEDHTHDKHYEKLNKQWRALHPPIEVKSNDG